MSARTRHAAELAARLADHQHDVTRELPHEASCASILYSKPCDCTGDGVGRNPGQIAQDVDKLLRLSASLRAIGEHKCNGTLPKCKACEGMGAIFIPGKEIPEVEAYECSDCDGSGNDTRREKRLVEAVTATLRPYGLTWTAGDGVKINFPGAIDWPV